MPRRDRFDEDEFDGRPRRGRRGRPDPRPGLATAAAVLWLVWAGLLLVAFLIRAVILFAGLAADADINPLCGCVDLLMVLAAAGWAGLAGFMTLLGRARSLTAFGVLSLVLPPAVVLVETAVSFFIGIELSRDLDRRRGDLPLVLAFRSFVLNSLLVSGVILAGIFALCANRRYRAWSDRQER